MAFLNASSSMLSLSHPSTILPSRRFDPSLIRCQQNADTAPPSRALSLDRRGVLLGLTGLYGAVTTTSSPALALEHSDHSTHPHTHNHTHPTKVTKEAIDYVLPPSSAPKRVRRPAHLVDAAYIAQFEDGLQKMKDLPSDHPWNLDNHAAAHPPGVHDGWLFLPWHRLYIHFFERAIGHLTGDPTFALPFWNFDSPDGMAIPSLFLNPNSPLYNPARDPAHLPPALIDLRYAYTSGNHTALNKDEQIKDNLWQIGMAFRQSLTLGPLWAGGPAKEGVPFYGGRFENLHKPIHQWVGVKEVPFSDMGNPHRTSRDPMFYSLHANMDRLWDVYRGFRGNRDDYSDPEWLNIPFTFYDENGQLVRVKVGDASNSSRLGYTYEQVPLLWADKLPSNPDINTWGTKITAVSSAAALTNFGSEPRLVDTSYPPVRVIVNRPKAPLTKHDKEEHVEVLHVKGVDVIPGQSTRFDVFVSTPMNGGFAGPKYGVYAGNFIKPFVVHAHNHEEKPKEKEPKKKKEKGGLKLGLAPVLEVLGAEGADKLVVTFVPRDGKVMVDGVGVELLQTDGSLLI